MSQKFEQAMRGALFGALAIFVLVLAASLVSCNFGG